MDECQLLSTNEIPKCSGKTWSPNFPNESNLSQIERWVTEMNQNEPKWTPEISARHLATIERPLGYSATVDWLAGNQVTSQVTS